MDKKYALHLINDLSKYLPDYDSIPIGGGNPYYMCPDCERSDPEVSYLGHYRGCKFEEIEDLKRRIKEANE